MTAKRAVEPKEDNKGKKTCFVMMPISDVDGYPPGHFAEVYKQLIEPAVNAADYECTLATSTSAAHLIQLEVVTKVATADLCICDLSTNNPNVLFEYGIRQAFDKPTVLIKDDKTRRLFDLSGFRDIEYDHTLRIANTLNAREAITTAIADTVSGAGDEEQVFSLVKLMKLTKAALPAGEVNRDDARFALLERKLDSILALNSPQTTNSLILSPFSNKRGWSAEHVFPRSHPFQTPTYFVKLNDRWVIEFHQDSVSVMDEQKQKARRYFRQDQLEATDFWKELADDDRTTFLNWVASYSPDFPAFPPR